MTLVDTDAVSNAGRLKTKRNSYRHVICRGMEETRGLLRVVKERKKYMLPSKMENCSTPSLY
jgi:hypothetical protein